MQLTPEQVQILQQVALMNIENEAKTTERVIAAIPADRCDYKPHEVAMNSLELAKHIANSELQFLRGIAAGAFDFGSPVPESVKTPQDVAKWYGEEVAREIAALRALPADKLAKTIDFFGMMQMPAVLYLNLAANHSIHHRGQLSTHLRPIGAKVPSIYGPTYEETVAHKATASA